MYRQLDGKDLDMNGLTNTPRHIGECFFPILLSSLGVSLRIKLVRVGVDVRVQVDVSITISEKVAFLDNSIGQRDIFPQIPPKGSHRHSKPDSLANDKFKCG